jgi:type II secretory pathway component PulJ
MNKKGFTLVEVIISITIFILVIITVSLFQFNVINHNNSSQISLSNIYESEAILKTMIKEMRTMKSSANGSYPILNVATSTITFYSDSDGNGIIEQIRYYLSTTTLYRGKTDPSGTPATYNINNESKKILVTGVRNDSNFPIFEYYSSVYAGTSTSMTYPIDIKSVRLIKINLTIDSDPNKSPVPITFTSQTSLRNLKDNQ